MATAVTETESPLQATATYNQRFEEIVGRFQDRIAFQLKTPEGYRKVTYRDLYAQSKSVALGLIATGLKPGGRVAIISENRPEWIVAYLGIFLAGGTAVPLDPQISAAEWRRLLDDSESKLVFVSGLHLAKLKTAIEGSAAREGLICLDAVPGAAEGRATMQGFVSWANSVQPAPSFPPSRISDVVVIIYTSGTTGNPKGVMLTQENIMGEIQGILRAIFTDQNDNYLCLLPLQHVFASIVNFLLPLYIGAQVTFADTLKRTEILEAMQQAGITILPTVPQFFYLFHGRIYEELNKKPALVRRIFRVLLAINRLFRTSLHFNLGKSLFGKVHATFGGKLRLFVSGGSAFDPKVAQDFHDLGFNILQGYGLTETTGACTVTTLENNVLGSVGPALPGTEVKIVEPDESGVGEIAVRGPVVMKGYYRNPEATAKVLRDGWFFTGDLGRLARGNLFITGRRKEVIVLPSGKNIYPDEIETHYLQCPYIQEIAVLGIRNPGSYESAERLHAVVVPNFDYLKSKKIANAKEILRDEIARWSNQLPQYKRLMSYQIQKDPLPRTTTRKIKRLELKRLIESGELQDMESAETSSLETAEDQALKESNTGQEVLRILKETYHRNMAIHLGMNLELDLGFDSMERVELLANLEQALNLELPDDFAADVHTVRDLISKLEQQVSAPVSGRTARQSWKDILAPAALDQEGEWKIRFSGPVLTFLKYLGMCLIYVLLKLLLRMEVRGVRNLPGTGPFLICPNHLSYVDPFVVIAALPYRLFRKVFFVGASEYFQTWYMRLIARWLNIVPVDPDAQVLRAMKVGAYGLRKGRILCIFPEGARAIDGKLKEFKKGAAILAREVGVPIVPVGIHGTYDVWARDSWKIRLHTVRVAFGTPLQAASGEGTAAYDETTQRLQQEVARLSGR
jgi:long-chain acyl-CoA synthetase